MEERSKAENALEFVSLVKRTFKDQPEMYSKFLDILKQYRVIRSIDTKGLIDSVVQLFRGHPALILELNPFLPAGCALHINAEGILTKMAPGEDVIAYAHDEHVYAYHCYKSQTEESVQYLSLVKEVFKDTPEVYHELNTVLAQFRYKSMDTEDAIDHIVQLFEGHLSLILALNNFMPNGFEIRISADGVLELQLPNGNMTEYVHEEHLHTYRSYEFLNEFLLTD